MNEKPMNKVVFYPNRPSGERKPAPSPEWQAAKRWNPFNSYKLLAHVERWSRIQRGGALPAPALITVDPTNYCNHDCLWCNAEAVRSDRGGMLAEGTLLKLADFLPRWGEGSEVWRPGVPAICVAGGGEPLTNPGTGPFIEKAVAHGVEVGVVTNGSYIGRFTGALAQTTWVGVSVDAGSDRVFNQLKRLPENGRTFSHILDQIANLVDFAKRHGARLASDNPSYGVSYKFLVHPGNVHEVYEAARIAKAIGCKNVHYRPAGTPWDKLGSSEEIHFSEEHIRIFQEQIARALELDDENFGVYGVTHKFDSQFGRANQFDHCFAVFMTSVVMPPLPGDDPESFTLNLCCDRRGDARLELLRNCTDVEAINGAWGSADHWRIHDEILVAEQCPRCTYQPHNQIYEQVIVKDSMTYRFI